MSFEWNHILIINCFILPMLSGALGIVFWKNFQTQRIIYLLFSLLLLLNNVLLFSKSGDGTIITLQLAALEAPYGITVVADSLSSLLVTLVALISVLVYFFSIHSLSSGNIKNGFYPMMHLMLMGINGAFLAGDLFNLYVWYEVMLVSSFVLLTLSGRRKQLEGTFKYVVINLVSSGILLVAIGLVYTLRGSLNLAHLASLSIEGDLLWQMSGIFFLIAFSVKSAAFPLYFWLPASYPVIPVHISAVMAGLLTKVGVYSMIRVFSLLYLPEFTLLADVMLIIAGASMIVGMFGAIAHKDIRKIFSYLIIGHIGFIIMGLGLFTEVSLQGSLLYLIHDILIKTTIFLLAGMMISYTGQNDYDKIRGLASKSSGLSFMFLVCGFSLAGIPPLSGFWGKYMLTLAGIREQQFLIVAAGLLASFLTLFVIGRIWIKSFWRKTIKDKNLFEVPNKSNWIATSVLLTLILLIGFYVEPVAKWSKIVTKQLIDNSDYIDAVLK